MKKFTCVQDIGAQRIAQQQKHSKLKKSASNMQN